MNDLIQRLVNAIIRQEGKHPDALNPGDLRAAPWRPNPIVNLGFWCPGSRNEGIAGAAHQVCLNVARGYSLKQLIGTWAPPNENDTEAYIAHVKEWAQISDENVPLWSYLT